MQKIKGSLSSSISKLDYKLLCKQRLVPEKPDNLAIIHVGSVAPQIPYSTPFAMVHNMPKVMSEYQPKASKAWKKVMQKYKEYD